MLTVYRSGLINLNGEATRLMHDKHVQIDLLPPPSRRQPWQLDRREGAGCKLVGRADRGHLRFRAPYRTAALFENQPAEVGRILFRITPHTQYLDLYTLAAELPVSSKPATVQQKPRRKAA